MANKDQHIYHHSDTDSSAIVLALILIAILIFALAMGRYVFFPTYFEGTTIPREETGTELNENLPPTTPDTPPRNTNETLPEPRNY